MADARARFTPDELLAELRRREADATDKGAAGGLRSGGAAVKTRAPRGEKLADLPSGKLAKELQDTQRAIYGVDNRQDFFQMPQGVKSLAESSVALVKEADLIPDGTGWRLETTVFGDDYQLCSDEPFRTQPLGCFCSGVLVRPNVIATAGHCVESNTELATMRFVFGFRMENAKTPRTRFDADDVYAGKKLIGRQLTADGTDWALVQLDRPVKGRTAVKFRTSGKIGNKDRLFVIGHPCGLPQKYADDATVQTNVKASFFSATLDTYGGNSGSPVFNAKTKALEGLLVRGQTDFVSVGNCRVSQVFPSTGAGGEDVTRATVWAAKVPSASPGAVSGGTKKKSRAKTHATGKRK